MAIEYAHKPVLVQECLAHLALGPRSVVVDGTVGGGGHATAILERCGPEAILIGLDLDPAALDAARRRLEPLPNRVHWVHASFRRLEAVVRELGVDGVDAVLLDLGVSSHQLDTASRGFRFSPSEGESAPLDMRMDPTRGESAAELLKRASFVDLERWFRDYGELRGARRLARAIEESREHAPLETAQDLVRVLRAARIGGGRRHDPATLVFQALRIAVNDELGALREGLDAAVAVLRHGGRLVVLSYHSLEDRIVKHHFRAGARPCTCPPEVPVCVCGGRVTLRVVTRRPVRATDAEIAENPRARSARLRTAERVREAA